MESLRFKAIEQMLHHKPVEAAQPEGKVSDYFGVDVFSIDKMRDYLSSDAYESVVSAITEGRRIDRKIADQVANGMKRWAMERGVTHYTHWFQPLNEATAEKHDTFAEPVWGEIVRWRSLAELCWFNKSPMHRASPMADCVTHSRLAVIVHGTPRRQPLS